jgi:glycosyltransferase involved in cell wall biosynthesis
MDSSQTIAMPTAAIFRTSLFRASEPFIHEQALALRAFRPMFVGRRAGTAPSGAADTRTLAQSQGAWAAKLHYVMLLLSGAWNPYASLFAEETDVALVHAHFGMDASQALVLAKTLNVPLVTTFHGLEAILSTGAMLRSGRPNLMRYALYRSRLVRRGTLFLCVSDFLRERLLAVGFPPERTITHYIGVDCTFFRPVESRSGKDYTPTVLHVARLAEVKGTRYLIEAFADVERCHPTAQLVIIGDGPLRASLSAQAAALGIGQQVHFLGTQPHATVREWMQRATVFCLPSCVTGNGEQEGFGLSAVEAAACGVPIVVTRCGGLAETVISDRTGYLVEPKSANDLAGALKTILGDAERCAAMGDCGRILATERFNLVRQTALLEAHYQRAIRDFSSTRA